MEVVTADGTVTRIEAGQILELGRGHGFDSSDRTISRRQISFSLSPSEESGEIRVRFEVVGRNPIYVQKNKEVKICRRSETGEMDPGDMFSVSARNPSWYSYRTSESGSQGVRRNALDTLLSGNFENSAELLPHEKLEYEGVDISEIDPITEFGFVVSGHEFDSYPKKNILEFNKWDWFLEEDEDNKGKGRSRRNMKRKKKNNNDDDEEWTGESENDEDFMKKSSTSQRPTKYITRSKLPGRKDKRSRSKSKKQLSRNEDEDETLGGFIVDDVNLEEEEEERV